MTRKAVIRLLILPLLVALLCTGPVLAQDTAHPPETTDLTPQEEILPDLTGQAALGSAFTYQGRLLDGALPANGQYDMAFRLYTAVSGGAIVGSTITKDNLAVTNGLFTVDLDFGSNVFSGTALWLQVYIRPGDSTGSYQTLSPRTALNAAPSALTLMPGAAISRDFSGATLKVYNGYPSGSYAITKSAIYGVTSSGSAIIGISETGRGVVGVSETSFGVYAHSTGTGRNQVALRASNLYGAHGMAAYMTNASDYHTAHFYNSDSGGVLYLQNGGAADGSGGGEFITARNRAEDDIQFRVMSDGQIRTDSNVVTGGADFAEMLLAASDVEPGDLLAIGPDGALVKAVGAYSTLVAGVYSTEPGFVGGGGGAEGEGLEGKVPLAVLGVVPVKASDQNGPIVPGDLLVASDTPGHVMKGADRDLMLGAVVGKALSGLASGTGTVTVLVTLQ